ncbi:hypothetical protein [Streptomyces thermodiastaticus]|uniref:hypothetical protein n=1 Tax=Streptomyces thermodiastaticus TaxID=44061 RepID=UPI001678CD4B|nr:hypothetical protein [Streptomyces thermodiastaticus]MCE7548576.1 hypothetical protein [Streptomyces thermodiastaticus]GHF81874.1 hypothetical protein GCM10018787_33360 [Streptomyces thermodiastaticus]
MIPVTAALKAVAAAERRKLDIPDQVRAAAAVQAAVEAAARQDDPEPPALPDSAADVAQAIREYAAALQLADATRRAADRFRDEADQRYVDAVRACLPAWIAGLQKEYTALMATVRKAAAKLPADLSQLDPQRLDWNNPALTAAYNKAEGAAVQLDQLVNDRADMVQVAGGDGGRDNALYAVAALPEPTTDRVLADEWLLLSPIVATWRDLRHQPVARWVHLVRQDQIDLSLATPGEVRQRASQAERWRDAGWARRSAYTLTGAQAAVTQYLSETA